jgi:ADP-ribosyl-[dinitrogen reductase] hydrolase
VVGVVNEGGDTDTNGALAGAVMGARYGASSIPPRWLANVADTKGLMELADRLFEGPH